MKQIIFFISTLIFFFGCISKTEKTQTETQTTNQSFKIQADSIPAQEIEKLINVPIRDKFNEIYNGYYNITFNEVGDEILNGEFEFIHFDSSAMYNNALDEYDYSMISVSKIQYTGTFNNGKKDGVFTEKLLFDDGVDLYSKWMVSIDYRNDKCFDGTFTGILGHVMKETTYEFEKLDTCTFQSVVDKA